MGIDANDADTALATVERPLSEAESSWTAGKFVGAYEILENIGSGGMGLVFKVRHRGVDNVMAMKILRPELAQDPINVKRFQQELKTTGLLNHANMVPIFDSGVTEGGAPYFVMEYLDGLTLEEIIKEEGCLDLDRFFQIFLQVCEALAFAHEKHVIHRDLKPANIMVSTTDTGFELVKVLDFGIARVFQKATREKTRLTQMGEIVGSPTYMSPEQCLNQKLDERSDIYALGVVMYEALAGAPPFAGESSVEIIMGHLQQKPRALSKIRPDFNIPSDLEALIMSCLEKETAARVQNLGELQVELQRISTSLRSKSIMAAIRRLPRQAKTRLRRSLRHMIEYRKKLVKPAAVSLILAGAGFGCYQFWWSQQTVESFIDRAQLSLIHGRYEDVANNWQKAIDFAKSHDTSRYDLSLMYEEAGDDLQSNPYKSFSMGGSPVSAWPQNNQNPFRQERMKQLEQFYSNALSLKGPDISSRKDRIRLLDKLCCVSRQEADRVAEEQYLRQRMVESEMHGQLMTDNPSGYAQLAQLVESQGNVAEAEALLKKGMSVERLQGSQPYPSSENTLAEFYHRRVRYTEEEKLRREMIEGMRAMQAVGNDYRSQIADEYRRLADCYRKQGLSAESKSALKDARKWTTMKMPDGEILEE